MEKTMMRAARPRPARKTAAPGCGYSMGSDPEMMLDDAQGRYRSAIGIVPGTKENPLRIGNASYFWDNVLAECCPAPGATLGEVLDNFRQCFQQYAQVVAPLRLVPQASQEYPAEECDHPGAREFGCDPEMNAYEMLTVLPPPGAEDSTFRTGGGHVHLGYVSGSEFPLVTEEGRWWATRFMDVFVGLPSIIVDHDATSQARRKLYGGAGNMRPKPYGIEYRTLSNFWLASPRSVELVWNLSGEMLRYLQSGDGYTEFWDEVQQDVRQAITEGDRSLAVKTFRKVASTSGMASSVSKAVLTTFAKPWHGDFYKEWDIKV